MRSLRVWLVLGLVAAGAVLLPSRSAFPAAEGEAAVPAEEFTKQYADNPAGFDKKYKGKEVTIEGVVADTSVRAFVPAGKPAGKTFLMIRGYAKAGAPVPYSVRCEESGPDFEGIHAGHKVRIRGTAQGHSATSFAAELRDCKVVKVNASDYPPSDAVRAEVKRLQGKWKVVGAEAGGKKLPAHQTGFDAITFEGYRVLLHQGNRVLPFGLALDPAKTPKTMDLLGGKVPLPCVYSLKDDHLRLSLPARGKDGGFSRPQSLDTAESKALVLDAERQK
jgi:uncharacterized protein (TIGR03067 family)